MKGMKLVKTLCYAVENQLKFVCRDLNDEDARWRPDNVEKSPAIGWIVGHVLVYQDILVSHRLCGNPIIFDNLIPEFGTATEGDFPDEFTLKEIFEKHKQINGEIVKIIESKDDSWLDEPITDTSGLPPNWQGKALGKGFILGVTHGMAHSGQILEIKRMRGKGAWGF
ncbi:MAG: DinB family protein [Candidatus Hodarchaeales archaeon]